MNGRFRTITLILLGAVLAVPTYAAAPPDRINYQGVLRDADARPLDGDHDMVFRFMSADVGGDEILVDEHDAAHANPVTVSGGLFSVELGGGAVSDGSGPGSYTSLAAVFRDHASVWLQLEVGGETLDPRVRVISAAYALNADYLDGVNSSALLRSNTSDSFTSGTLSMNGATTLDVNGTLRMDGPVTKASSDLVSNLNADLLDGLDSSAFAGSVHGHPGSDITSPVDEAVNTDTVDGRHASEFIDTSATPQTKAGELTADASALALSVGVRGLGQSAGGYFEDTNQIGYAYVGRGNRGVEAYGWQMGGSFEDTDDSGFAYLGYSDYGIWARGATAGGYFESVDGTGNASLGRSLWGISSWGSDAGGYFEDLEDTGMAKIAHGDYGVWARGSWAGGYFYDDGQSGYGYVGVDHYGYSGGGNFVGGYFFDRDSTGEAWVGYGDYGIEAHGNEAGGHFRDADNTGYAYVGKGDYGMQGYGSIAGGFFEDLTGDNDAWVGHHDYGIRARGTEAGGYFLDPDGTGIAYAARDDVGLYGEGFLTGGEFRHTGEPSHVYLAYGGTGVYGGGDEMGGYIFDTDGTSYATLASGTTGIDAHGSYVGGRFSDSDSTGYANVGYGNYGISAHGSYVGGHFEDTDHTGYAYLAFGNTGIEARGSYQGGYFADSDDSGYTRVAYGDRGIWAKGTFAGGTFSHPDNVTFWVDASTSTHKIVGTGAVSFMQNHPYEEDRVIVYAAPEGDEVAVYTRGTARLVDGEARVRLGETFQCVANPDIGLTAHITPRSADAVVYVESVSTSELVVRSVAGFAGDATFDYLVYGLRLGFEELSIVKQKQKDALLPTAEAIEADYAGHPELRSFNAMERYRDMHAEVFPESEIDLSRSRALVAALESQRPAALARAASMEEPISDDAGVIEGSEGAPEAQDPRGAHALAQRERAIPDTLIADSDPEQTAGPAGVAMPVSVPVEPGDVMVFDIERPGMLRPVTVMADTTVAGIAVGPSWTDEELGEQAPLQVQVALTGLVECKVDADYGTVRAGDLLTTSPTPGHAMRALEPLPGTILGKAAESLEAGTGKIRVLVMPQ